MHPELLVRKRIWLMTLVLTGLFLLAAARIAVLTTSEAASLTERGIRQWTKAGIVTARRTKTIAGQDEGVDYLKAAGQPRDGRCPASAAVRRAGGQRLEGAVL